MPKLRSARRPAASASPGDRFSSPWLPPDRTLPTSPMNPATPPCPGSGACCIGCAAALIWSIRSWIDWPLSAGAVSAISEPQKPAAAGAGPCADRHGALVRGGPVVLLLLLHKLQQLGQRAGLGARRLLLQLLLPLLWRLRGLCVLGSTAYIAGQSLQCTADCLPVGTSAAGVELGRGIERALGEAGACRVIGRAKAPTFIHRHPWIGCGRCPCCRRGAIATKPAIPERHRAPPSDCAGHPLPQSRWPSGSSAGAARAPPAPSERGSRRTVPDDSAADRTPVAHSTRHCNGRIQGCS